MNDRGFAVLEALDRAATAHDATPAQVALAWLMARPGLTAPIASATTVPQLQEIMGAIDLTLDHATIAALDSAQAA